MASGALKANVLCAAVARCSRAIRMWCWTARARPNPRCSIVPTAGRSAQHISLSGSACTAKKGQESAGVACYSIATCPNAVPESGRAPRGQKVPLSLNRMARSRIRFWNWSGHPLFRALLLLAARSGGCCGSQGQGSVVNGSALLGRAHPCQVVPFGLAQRHLYPCPSLLRLGPAAKASNKLVRRPGAPRCRPLPSHSRLPRRSPLRLVGWVGLLWRAGRPRSCARRAGRS